MKAVAIAILLALGCYSINEGIMPLPGTVQVRRAHITELRTTTNALGSFAGDQIPNLQVDNLEAGEYTLQFQVIEPPIDSMPYAAYAIVRWKVQGQQIQRIINVFSGATIEGVAQAVDVYLLDQSERIFNPSGPIALVINGSPTVTTVSPISLVADEIITFQSQPGVNYYLAAPVINTAGFTLATPYTGVAGLTPFVAQTRYKVGVALSKGTRPTIMQPPCLATFRLLTLTPGAISFFNVPQDAGIISVLASVVVNGAFPQAEAANGVISFGIPSFGNVMRYIPQVSPEWYPIPPGTVLCTLENHSTTRTLDFSLQWGIEG